ncbi:MAG: asparagine--tRNA ligase [Pseudomonadota bacterium]
MKTPSIKEILKASSPQSQVTLQGWIKTRRDSKGFSFMELNDGSCRGNLQVIVDEKVPAYALLKKLTPGTSLKVRGDLVKSPGKEQALELKAQEIEIYGECDPETYPIQKKNTSDEYLRTVAHMRPRTNKYAAMLRIRSELAFAVHQFFRQNGFFYVQPPIITSSDCEGAGQMFQVTTVDVNKPPRNEKGEVDYSKDFFGKKAYMTVSAQLEGEALALSLGKIYTFGPTFRAENSNTPRHCAEFWQIEPEMAFYTLEDNMELGEAFVKSIVGHAVKNCAEDLELFNKFVDTSLLSTLQNILENNFQRLPYTEAITILEKSGQTFEQKPYWGLDLGAEHEKFIVEKHFKKPVILYNYPKEIKSFYMKQNEDGKTVRGMDLLVPRIGELIGGSEREWRHDILCTRIKELNMREEDYWWYLDLRRFGTVPHSGFGLGFERAMMLVIGINNIRDVTAFPRVPGFAEF